MIQIKNISKKYNNLLGFKKKSYEILNQVNFEIYEKDIVGIVGRNGSGKTTLLKILFNLIKPDNGSILYNSSASNYLKFIKSSAALVNNNDRSFFWRLTLLENLKFFLALSSIEIDEKILTEKAKFLEIEHSLNKKFGFLSSGEKSKALILRGLLRNPKLIFFDEITGNLDITAKKNILNLIKKINDSGTTVVYVTHSLDEIDVICNRFIILNNGEVSKIKKRDEIDSKPSEYIYKNIKDELSNTNIY